MTKYRLRWKTPVQRVFTALSLITCLTCLKTSLFGQSLLDVPDEVAFAGTTIHLDQPGRLRIQQEIQRLYTHPNAVQTDIDALRQLTPLLKPLLNNAKLPDDFRFLALPFADIDTIGFWSLSPREGRYLSLRVDKYIDERFHPIISTETALKEISHLQGMQRNYALTLIRYLQWNTNLRTSELPDPNYILLGPKSPPLVWKILARKLVFEHEESTNRPAAHYILFQYQNGAGQTLGQVAQRLRIAEERTKPFNQWLKTTVIPADKYYPVLIRVTPDEFLTVQALAEPGVRNEKLRQLATGFPVLIKLKAEPDKLRSAAIYYEINGRKGVQAQNCDNFITLAFYGDIRIDNFLEFNDLNKERDVIRPGRIYYLQRKARRAKIPFHVTQRNQTLPEVAAMYGIRLVSLVKFNRLNAPQRLQTGRLLWLQRKRPASRPIEFIQLPAEEQYVPPAQDSVIVQSLPPVQDSVQTPPGKIESFSKQLTVADSAVMLADSLHAALATVHEDTLKKWDTILTPIPDKIILHVVTPGQTYYAISRLYGVTVDQLYDWNNLSARNVLQVGQKLMIKLSEPQPKTRPAKLTSKLPNSFVSPPKRKAIFYTVEAGQTLYRIALLNKVSVKDLMRWNKLTGNIIEIGQILLIWK